MRVGPFPWIASAMAGIMAVPREPGDTGQRPHVCVFSPLPLAWEGGVRACMWCVRPMLALTPARSAPWAVVLCGIFASGGGPTTDSELMWTKGYDKLGAGVTQESHKKL
jgi:hypothetical protein